MKQKDNWAVLANTSNKHTAMFTRKYSSIWSGEKLKCFCQCPWVNEGHIILKKQKQKNEVLLHYLCIQINVIEGANAMILKARDDSRHFNSSAQTLSIFIEHRTYNEKYLLWLHRRLLWHWFWVIICQLPRSSPMNENICCVKNAISDLCFAKHLAVSLLEMKWLDWVTMMPAFFNFLHLRRIVNKPNLQRKAFEIKWK